LQFLSHSVEFGLKINKDEEGEKVNSTLFKQIIGSLMYLTTTRPDIKYAVSLISIFMENPTTMHLLAAKKKSFVTCKEPRILDCSSKGIRSQI